MKFDVWTTVLLLTFSVLIAIVEKVDGLSCIQCDRQGVWYSPEENERHILRCQRGHIASTICANSSHTHCIYSYYKQAGVVTITERRCGTAMDITGCTIYKSTASSASRRLKMRRHLIGGAQTDTPLGSGGSFFGAFGFGGAGGSSARANTRRRDATPLLVEVCTAGCQGDGCTSAASRPTVLAVASTAIMAMTWLAIRKPMI